MAGVKQDRGVLMSSADRGCEEVCRLGSPGTEVAMRRTEAPAPEAASCPRRGTMSLPLNPLYNIEPGDAMVKK